MIQKESAPESQSGIDRVYVAGLLNKLQVGMRQVRLTDTKTVQPDGTIVVKANSAVTLYDTSGLYADPAYRYDLRQGLRRIREEWYERRKDIRTDKRHTPQPPTDADRFPVVTPLFLPKEKKQITQLYYAKKRVVTPEMEYVAIRENQQIETLGLKSYITPDFVRKEIAAGRAVIPANVNHPEVEPMIIGGRFLVKTNTILYPTDAAPTDTVHRLIGYCLGGSDTIVDLADRADCLSRREWIVRNSPVPIGTNPLYEALGRVGGKPEELTWELFRDTLIDQVEQGVDFMTIHAAVRRKILRLAEHRLTSLSSRSAMALTRWMKAHKAENFLHTHFGEICEILRMGDTVVSLGCGLRPGSIYDANDRAQFAELGEMRPLIEMAWEQSVQVMSEASGHIPLNKLETGVKEQRYHCRGVPFFVPGVTTTDVAGRHHHIAAAIGTAQLAWMGASLLGNGDGREADEQPSAHRILHALTAQKIAAHVADLAKGHPGAQVRDNAYSKALREGRTADLQLLALDAANLEILSLPEN